LHPLEEEGTGMVSERERRDLHTALERELGAGPATTLMELLPPFGWSEVARQPDLVAVRGEMAQLRGELKGEMAQLRAELKGEMAQLRAELRTEMADVRIEISELRTRIAGQLPRLIAANIASMVAVAALVLAAAKLA
jgi:ribosomal protein L29